MYNFADNWLQTADLWNRKQPLSTEPQPLSFFLSFFLSFPTLVFLIYSIYFLCFSYVSFFRHYLPSLRFPFTLFPLSLTLNNFAFLDLLTICRSKIYIVYVFFCSFISSFCYYTRRVVSFSISFFFLLIRFKPFFSCPNFLHFDFLLSTYLLPCFLSYFRPFLYYKFPLPPRTSHSLFPEISL